jgi:hypothetical protein
MFSKKTIQYALVAAIIVPFIVAGFVVKISPQTALNTLSYAPIIFEGFKWFFIGLIILFIIMVLLFTINEKRKEFKHHHPNLFNSNMNLLNAEAMKNLKSENYQIHYITMLNLMGFSVVSFQDRENLLQLDFENKIKEVFIDSNPEKITVMINKAILLFHEETKRIQDSNPKYKREILEIGLDRNMKISNSFFWGFLEIYCSSFHAEFARYKEMRIISN